MLDGKRLLVSMVTAASFCVVSLFFVSGPASAAIGTTVTFVVYDGQSPVPTATQVATTNSSANLELFTTLFPEVSYPGHSFVFWSADPGGGGATYLDGASFPFTTDTILYAQFAVSIHTVTFAENASLDDQVVSSEIAAEPTPLTLFANLSPAFSDPNHTFSGWNTEADGSGKAYSDGSVFDFQSDIELYAQWTPVPEVLTFNLNQGVGLEPSINGSFGEGVVLPSGNSITRLDYQFVGWNTMPDGSGTEYKPGSTFTLSSNETFYAMWSRIVLKISFVTQVAHHKVKPVSVLAGNSVRLPSLGNLKRPGYHFVRWLTSSGASAGKGGGSFSPSKSVTLIAHWAKNPTVHLEFSDNGGVGHMPSRNVSTGLSVVIPNDSRIHRSGFTFRGWANSPHVASPTVRIGSHIVLTHTTILYALWRRDLPANTPQVLLGSVGVFAPDSSALTASMRHDIAVMAIGIDQHNRTLILLYGYATAKDSAHGSALLSLQRALAVEKQLNEDLAGLNDVGVIVRAVGEGRLSNSVLTSFRNVEVFAN